MGLKTRITSQGVVTTRESDGEATFSVQVSKLSGVTSVSGSAESVAFGSTTLFQSGTHPSLTVTMPTIAAADIGKTVTVMHEFPNKATTLSGTQAITGSVWTLVYPATEDSDLAVSLMAVSGSEGFRWIKLFDNIVHSS